MRGRDRVVAVTIALGVGLAIGVRLHVLDDDFPNPDIAGITYNAEVLLRGGLPYVDTAEIKPPGAFLLAAGAIAVFGRSLEGIQLLFALWLGLGALGVWLASRAIHEPVAPDEPRGAVLTARRTAALAAMIALVTMAMFSYNYSAWMAPSSALAVGAALHGLRRDKLAFHVLAGACALVAVATIQRAAVLAILLPVLVLWGRRRALPGARFGAVLGWLGGAAAALLILAIPWLLGGEPSALVRGVLPLEVARDYSGATRLDLVATLAAAVLQLLRVFWFPVGLLAVAVLAAVLDRDRDVSVWIPGAVWLVLSVVGAGLGGMRFYLHYLVQYAPALALLAAHPALVRRLEGALSRRWDGRTRDRGVLTLAGLLVVGQTIEIGLGRGHRHESRARRLRDGRTAAQAAGEHIRRHTAPTDTVLAWGWTAWPIYWFSDRRSPSRIYKPLGTVTTFNTNTELVAGEGPRFRPGPLADELVAAIEREPPAYFVYSPSMVDTFGARPDPLEAFTALHDRLRADYVPEALYGDLRLFRHREHAARDPAGRAPPPLEDQLEDELEGDLGGDR